MTTAKAIFFVDSFFLDTQNDVNKSEPEEIWLQLINNNVNIDYVEAVNRLLECNFDPFVSNTPNLLFSCLDTVSKNPDIPFDNLPSRMLLYIVYFQQLKKLYTKNVCSNFK
jgi:hypothetical protein